MRTYEDLFVGDAATSEPTPIDRADMIAFARRYDPQWFHSDEDAARGSVFGEVVASGVYSAAIWRKLDHTINGDIDFICGVAWEDVRWPTALRGDDVVRATSEVLEKRSSSSDPSRGVVTFRYRLINQHDTEVFSCRSINLVRRRSSA